MITLVNAVIPKTIDGTTVNTVINTKICKDKEYVASPFSPTLDVKAGIPKMLLSCPKAVDEIKLKNKQADTFKIKWLIGLQALL
jgi:hypothetical protein